MRTDDHGATDPGASASAIRGAGAPAGAAVAELGVGGVSVVVHPLRQGVQREATAAGCRLFAFVEGLPAATPDGLLVTTQDDGGSVDVEFRRPASAKVERTVRLDGDRLAERFRGDDGQIDCAAAHAAVMDEAERLQNELRAAELSPLQPLETWPPDRYRPEPRALLMRLPEQQRPIHFEWRAGQLRGGILGETPSYIEARPDLAPPQPWCDLVLEVQADPSTGLAVAEVEYRSQSDSLRDCKGAGSRVLQLPPALVQRALRRPVSEAQSDADALPESARRGVVAESVAPRVLVLPDDFEPLGVFPEIPCPVSLYLRDLPAVSADGMLLSLSDDRGGDMGGDVISTFEHHEYGSDSAVSVVHSIGGVELDPREWYQGVVDGTRSCAELRADVLRRVATIQRRIDASSWFRIQPLRVQGVGDVDEDPMDPAPGAVVMAIKGRRLMVDVDGVELARVRIPAMGAGSPDCNDDPEVIGASGDPQTGTVVVEVTFGDANAAFTCDEYASFTTKLPPAFFAVAFAGR